MNKKATANGTQAWFITIFIFFFGRGILNASWSSRGPEVQQLLGIDISQMGILAAIYSSGGVLGVMAGGALVRRFGARLVSVCAFAILGFSFLIVTIGCQIGSLPLVLVALFCFGLPFGTIDFVSNVEAGELERASKKSRIPLLHGGYSIGFLAGALITSLLIFSGVPLLLQFGLSALIVGAFAVARAWNLPDLHGANNTESRTEKVALPRETKVRVTKLSIIAFIFVLAEGTAAVFIPLALVQAGRSQTEAALAFTMFSLGMAISRIFGGRIVDRVGRRAVILWSAVICGVGIGAFALSGIVPIEYPAAFFWGIGNSLAIGMTVSAVSDSQRLAARSQSVLWTWIYFANLSVGPMLGGLTALIGVFPAFIVPVALLAGGAALSKTAEPEK